MSSILNNGFKEFRGYGVGGALLGGTAGGTAYAIATLTKAVAHDPALAAVTVLAPAIFVGLALGLSKGISTWNDTKPFKNSLDR